MFLSLVAAASFACANPVHKDGATLRCNGIEQTMRLEGLIAPPLRGACGTFDFCAPDEGAEARDQLADLTRGRTLICKPVRRARDGVQLVRCEASGADLSCAMVRGGHAIADGTPLGCDAVPALMPVATTAAPASNPVAAWMWRWVPWYLVAVNLFTYLMFAIDKQRQRRGLNRVPDVHFLLLTVMGGGGGAVLARQSLDHMRDEEPFATQFTLTLGAQIGALIGIFALAYWPL